MKKITLFLFGLLLLGTSKAFAAMPTFGTNSNSAYVIVQSTVQISSQCVVSSTYTGSFGGCRIGAVNGYRQVTIQMFPSTLQGGTSVFFMFNASTGVVTNPQTSIYNSGYMVVLTTQPYGVNTGASNPVNVGNNYPNEVTFETNGTIFGMTGVGVPAINARVLQKRIPQ